MINSSADGTIVDVRVIPRAAKSAIAGTRDNAILVRLNAPPVDGAANAELIEVLSTALGIPTRSIVIVAGEHSRNKRVRVTGISAGDVERRLSARLSA